MKIKIYIPFNMVVDTDFGMIRMIEKVQNISEYPVNKLKSLLLKREDENPVIDYNRIRKLNISEYTYDVILEKYYEKVLPLSSLTDMLPFIINTHKLGVSNELQITVACDLESEMKYLSKITSSLNYTIDTELNSNINLNDFDYIFIKYIDQYYVDYLINTAKIRGKRIYVADYEFNTLYDSESGQRIIDPMLHIELESVGCVVCTVSLYNKKQSGGN